MNHATKEQWFEIAAAQWEREAQFAPTKEEKERRLQTAEWYRKLLAEHRGEKCN